MPSRKKAKGKARRAAKEAEAKAREGQVVAIRTDVRLREPLEAQMQLLQLIHPTSIDCHHGLDSLSPRDEKFCEDFINAFMYAFMSKDSVSVVDKFITALEATEEEYADVYSSKSKLESVVSMLLCSGTQCVLGGQDYQDYDDARFYASLACHFKEWMSVFVRKSKAALSWAKVIELCGADEHTLVAYYRKCIPCSCLDEKYKEVKSVKKVGWCFNPSCSRPNQMAERSKMFCCSRCGEVNYCSIECQKAHWKRHREFCNDMAKRKAAFASG